MVNCEESTPNNTADNNTDDVPMEDSEESTDNSTVSTGNKADKAGISSSLKAATKAPDSNPTNIPSLLEIAV